MRISSEGLRANCPLHLCSLLMFHDCRNAFHIPYVVSSLLPSFFSSPFTSDEGANRTVSLPIHSSDSSNRNYLSFLRKSMPFLPVRSLFLFAIAFARETDRQTVRISHTLLIDFSGTRDLFSKACVHVDCEEKGEER